MKRIIAIITVLIMTLSLLPAAFAAETDEDPVTAAVKHGDYLDERLIEPYDEESHGVIAFPEYETMYDFDSGKLPQGLKAENSEVEISDKYHGTTASYSLKWTTKGEGSRITLDSGTSLFHYWNGEAAVGIPLDWQSTWYLTVGLLQEAMPEDGSTRSFRVSLVIGGAESESYNVYLHRKGWTVFGNGVSSPTNSLVDSISITQTGGPGGEIYVDDAVLYVRNARELRHTPYAQLPELYSERVSDYSTHELTQEEQEAFEMIAQRALPDPAPIEKLPEDQMEDLREYYKKWNITPVEGTDFVNGYCPLYFHRAVPGNTKMNMDNYVMNGEYSYLCSTYKQLGSSYRAVQDPEQKAELKKYVVDIAKLALTYSNVPDSWYGGQGFADGAYYARDALAEAGLADEMSRQIKEQYAVDAILYSEHVFENAPNVSMGNNTTGMDFNWGIDADNIFNGANATMAALLVDADSPEKARDLYLFKDYMDKLLMNYSPSTYGTLKPDGSMFHHNVNKYDYGWRQAWDGLTKYVYWFHGTPFAPSEETLERISHFAEVRYQDLGMDGKGGVPGHQGSGIGTNHILRLAQSGTPDGSLEVDPYRAAEWMAYGNGGAEAEKFLAMGIKPADLPQSNLTESYAMKNIHRRSGWRAQTYAQNNYCKFNEYGRPATLFFNMGGILLDVPGQHAAMLINPDNNIYGRDTFVPAPGYNFNRAPGVTAPDTKDKTQLAAAGKGSSPYVGGVSTQNGNGVFMNQFDAADNSAEYGKTVASNFRFKKSYFYFDNMIVCLASNIGYGGDEAVSTGLFQEKMTDTDTLTLSGGKTLGTETYNETYTSDEVPWLSDNINQAMYYLFPGQSYTVTRGTQEFLFQAATDDFDGKGDFVSAYINHPTDETAKNQGSYAYIIAPSSSTERMEELETSMKSETPEFEILRQDEQAHVVRSNALNSTGYAVFDQSAAFEDGAVKKVSAPALLMTKDYEDGSGMSLAVCDPALRIDKTESNPYGWSQPKDLTVTLRGRWQVKASADYTARDIEVPEIKFTADGDTLFTVTCQDGLTNEYLLENIDAPLSNDLAQTITITDGSDTAEVDGRQVSLLESVTERDGVDMMAAADIAQILDAPIEWNEEENRAVIQYNDQTVTFTVDSRIATIDNDIVILDHAAVMENDRNLVPVSVLQDILKTNVLAEGDTVSYIRNDAEWKDWDEQPAPPTVPYLDSISVDGQPLAYTKNTREYVVEVPEGTQQLPEVTYTVSDDYTVTLNEGTGSPGRATLNLTDKNDRLNTASYTVKFVYPNSNYLISASVTPQAENAPENSMDGDFNSYWACDTNGGYITFELEEDVLYSGIGLAFMSGDKRKAYFDVEVSTDGQTWTMVYPNGETSGNTLGIERYDFTPIQGRFIRVKGYGNSTSEWFSLAEVEIYKTNL